MQGTLLMYARYGARADASVLALLDGLSNEDRERDRGSYYGSLSEMARHVTGAVGYFMSLITASLPDGEAKAVLAAAGREPLPKGQLSVERWAEFKAAATKADATLVAFVEALTEAEAETPIRLDWYDGNPPSVPLSFFMHQLFTHGTHHRGQISQVLDEMKVEHDFSGVDVEFLPKG